MRTVNMQLLAGHQRNSADPISVAIYKAKSGQSINPSTLRSGLVAAGLHVVDDPEDQEKFGFRKFGTLVRIIITSADDELMAMGASGDADDALLHAVLGYVREQMLLAS